MFLMSLILIHISSVLAYVEVLCSCLMTKGDTGIQERSTMYVDPV